MELRDGYLTPSRITTALSCSLRFYRSYILKLPGGPPGLAMHQGKVVHAALEDFGNDPSIVLSGAFFGRWRDGLPEDMRDDFDRLVTLETERGHAVAALESVAAEIVTKRPEIKDVGRTKEYREAVANGPIPKLDEERDRLLAIERKRYEAGNLPWRAQGPAPWARYEEGQSFMAGFLATYDALQRPEIIHTEVKARIEVDEFKLTGVIDAVWLFADGSTEVIDYKRAKGGDGNLERFVQAATYALTCQAVLGFLPDRVTFHYLKEREREVYVVREDWTERLIELCQWVKRMHNNEDWRPSFRTCNFCDYRPDCAQHFAFIPQPLPGEAA